MIYNVIQVRSFSWKQIQFTLALAVAPLSYSSSALTQEDINIGVALATNKSFPKCSVNKTLTRLSLIKFTTPHSAHSALSLLGTQPTGHSTHSVLSLIRSLMHRVLSVELLYFICSWPCPFNFLGSSVVKYIEFRGCILA